MKDTNSQKRSIIKTFYLQDAHRKWWHGYSDSGGATFQSEPMMEFMLHSLQKRESPYWNPYSAAGRFLERNNAGIGCYSTIPSEIVRQFTALIEDKKQYRTITSNGRQLFQNELSIDALRTNLYNFLPLEEQ